MVYGNREIDLGDGRALGVGYVVCFCAPTCEIVTLHRTERGEEVRPLATLSRDQLGALIEALSAVHEEMPLDGP